MTALLLALLPALLLALLLARGLYPGAGLIERLRHEARPRPSIPPRLPQPISRPAPRRRPGELLSAGLAGRAPPTAPPDHDRLTAAASGRSHKKENQMLRKMIGLGAACALIVPGAAAAHITANPAEGPSDGYATLDFEVPHGCEESPTTQVRVQIPESVPQATPGVHPGWSLETKEGPKEEIELHGETVTRGVSEVIWTAEDEPLPAHYLDRFAISVKLPAGEGETVYFPTVQKCEKGQTGWVEIPAEGESADELESPAPAVTLMAVASEHGAEEESAAGEEAGEEATEPTEDDGNGVAIAALVVGGLGLVFGGTSLMRSRNNG